MLQYIDNYKYSSASDETLDSELAELRQLLIQNDDCFELYQSIRNNIYKEIKIDELAVTRILNDLIQIKAKSESSFIVLLAFTANPLLSYAEIAKQFNITKQRVYNIVSEYAKKYVWLSNLIQIKGKEDCKNQNNRSVFFHPLDKKIASKIGCKTFFQQGDFFK